MAYKNSVTVSEVYRTLEAHGKTLLRVTDEAEQSYQALLEAQNGDNDGAWARRLFELPTTGVIQLTIVASDRTVEGQPGHAVFSGYVAGRSVELANFTNGGNNQITAITSVVNNDKLHIGNATGLGDETDSAAEAVLRQTTEEAAIVADIVSAMDALHNVKLSFTSAVTSWDRASDLEAFVL